MSTANKLKNYELILHDCQKIAQNYIDTWNPVDETWPIANGAAYVRLSTAEQAEVQHGSLENQIHSAYEEAKRRSHESRTNFKITSVFIESPSSGTRRDRKEFIRLQQHIAQGSCKFIATKEVSRLARNVGIWEEFINLCESKSCRLLIPGLPSDSSPMAYTFLRLLAVISQSEVEQTKYRIKTSVRISMKQGKFNSTHLTLGLDQKDNLVGIYEKNSAESKTVNFIFESYLELKSLGLVLDRLSEHKITNKNGKSFKRHALQNLLSNRKLISEWPIYENDKIVSIVKLGHEPVIERELFDRVQDTLTSSKRNRVKNAKRCYPLSTLLKIANEPDSMFRGSSGTGRKGDTFYYYRNEMNKVCLPCEDLEKITLDILVAITKNDPEIIKAVQKYKGDQLDQKTVLERARKSTQSELDKKSGEKKEKLDALTTVINSTGENFKEILTGFQSEIDRLNNETLSLQNRIKEIDAQILNVIEAAGFTWERFTDYLPQIATLIRTKHLELLRPLLLSLFESIEVTPPDDEGRVKLSFIVKGTSPRFTSRELVCGNVDMVEAGGIEPPSASLPQKGATYLVCVLVCLASLHKQNQARHSPSNS